MYYLKNTNFWMFGLFFFFYFFIMGAYFPFFPIWLHDINHISKSDTGIIFAAISLFSLLFQPLFGLLSDKLGLRKYLLWIITGMLVMFAPFFIFIFGPLLQYNILVGSIVGGIYLGFCFNAGAPAVEAFIEKVSRRSNFEFGRARMFGCVGWALCASIVGIMFTINNQFVFWLGSGCALILAVLLFFAKTDAPSSATVANAVGANHSAFSLKLALELFRQPKLWFLSLYVIGVSCTYDVFDQQFANFFTSFFATGEQGTRVFGYVTTMGELLNASIMFFAPLIINRIGGKNALLLAGTIMSVRIIGSSFATSALEVVILKTLHMFEVPFLLVGCFKYITSQFEVRFSATIYLVCFCFFKQLAMIFMSVLAGNMYESIGFQGAYLVLGLVALGFTLISVFTLSGPGPLSLLRRQVNEVALAINVGCATGHIRQLFIAPSSGETSVASYLFDPQLRKTCWCKTQGYDHQPNDTQRMKRPVHQVIAADTTQHTRKPRGKPGDDKTDPLHKRHQLASNSWLRRVIERQQQTERKRAAQT